MSTVLEGVAVRSPASALGLRGGDRITAVNGKPVGDWMEMKRLLHAGAAEAKETGQAPPDVTLSVERKGQTLQVTVPGQDLQRGAIDVIPSIPGEAVSKGLGEACLAALADVGHVLRGGLRYLLKRDEFAPRPIAVADDTNYIEYARMPPTAGISWNIVMIGLVGTLFGVCALLPLPDLPGFKVVMDGLEAARGQPLFSPNASEWLDSWGWTIWAIPLVVWVVWR